MNVTEFAKAALLIASNRRLTRADFELRQVKRFRRFAGFAMRRSPYYGRIMKERGINPATCVPEDFPVLTKTDVLSHFDEIVTCRDVTARGVEEFLQRSHDPKERYLGRYTLIHTSGTSGQVGYFIYDPKSWARAIAQVANAPSPGFMLRRRRLAFVGPTDGHYAGISMTGSARFPPLNFMFKGRYFEINVPMAKVIEGLNEFKPDILVSYGSVLETLAEKQTQGLLNIHPRVITNSAEPVPPSCREAIEKVFGPVLRNLYACSEHLCLAIREAGFDSMRLIEDDLIFELFDDHTLVTNMFNRAMPLIRYRMNDVLRPVASHPYGPYRAATEAVGRVEQDAKFVNRHGEVDKISQYKIIELMLPRVRRFQLRVTGDASCTLAIMLDSEASPKDREAAAEAATARLRAIFAQKEMENVAIRVEVVNDIPADSRTRKFKLIVDEKVAGFGA